MAKEDSFEKGKLNTEEAMRVADFRKGIKKVNITGRLAERGVFVENPGK